MNAIKDEKQWVIQMEKVLKKETQNSINNPVCIYQVPKSISDTKPEPYTPQVVALGPYHHFRSKTYHMQRNKVDTALRACDKLSELHDLTSLKNNLKDKALDIRDSYHEHLGIQDDTLLWIMVIDGLFLISLIERKGRISWPPPNKKSSNGEHQLIHAGTSSRTKSQFVDSLGRHYSLEAILRDVVLLENQIPKIALEPLLINLGSDRSLRSKLARFCTEMSPIKLRGNIPHREMVEPCHVLDALYQMVWLGKQKDEHKCKTAMVAPITDRDIKAWTDLWGLLPMLNIGFMEVFIIVIDCILKILSTLGISIPRDIFGEKKSLIPRATKLAKIGVKFCLIQEIGEGIRNISFNDDQETIKDKSVVGTLSLPALNLHGDFTEVVMRNLLAYEAAAMPDSPKFTRYVQLISGLIRTVSDVDLLKNASPGVHIVPTDANSDEVDNLFSSLKQATGSKGVCEPLDLAVEKVNGHYNNCKTVKMRKLVKKYLFISWKVFTALALLLVLFLLAMQTFCSIYNCPRIFKTDQLRTSA